MTPHTLLRTSPPAALVVAMVLSLLLPALLAAQDSASDTSDITVEIVPPGAVPPEPAPGEKPAAPKGQVGTLSAAIMWLPDPAPGQQNLSGLIAVQDHRGQATGWTIRLYDGSSTPAFLVRAEVGGTGFDIPDWIYRGIYVWDLAVGASLAQSPQLVTAPELTGYGLTIHKLEIEIDTARVGEATSLLTLLIMIPAAP